jgi:hypothetical protein
VVPAASTISNNERRLLRQEAWSAPVGVLQGKSFEPFIIFPPLCIAVVMMKWLLVTAASVALRPSFIRQT